MRRLSIEAEGGTVTLRGSVFTFYEKQLSQQCPRRVAGVRRLIDMIVVASRKEDSRNLRGTISNRREWKTIAPLDTGDFT